MALQLVCGVDFWCYRHCRTSPVFLEWFLGQVWPKFSRRLAHKSELRIANEPLSFDTVCFTKRYTVELSLLLRFLLGNFMFVTGPARVSGHFWPLALIWALSCLSGSLWPLFGLGPRPASSACVLCLSLGRSGPCSGCVLILCPHPVSYHQ